MSTVEWSFLIVVVFWLAAIFASFGVFAPLNSSVTVALFIAALSAARLNLFDAPNGPALSRTQVSSAPLRNALQQIDRP